MITSRPLLFFYIENGILKNPQVGVTSVTIKVVYSFVVDKTLVKVKGT